MSTASVTDSAMATSRLTTTTRPTESWNIDSLPETSAPSATMRSLNVWPPMSSTPRPSTAMATTATESAAIAMRASMPSSHLTAWGPPRVTAR